MKQKSKTFRKLLSLTLCLIMVLGTVAVGGDGIAELLDNFAVKANAEETGYKTGDSIYFGRYPQSEIYNITGLTKDVDYVTVNNKYYAYEPIEWIVLDAEKGLCVSKYALDTIKWDSHSYKYDQSDDYKISYIRKWLYGDNGTGTFYTKAFTDTEKSLILKNNIVTNEYCSNEIKSTVTDKVFLLSVGEAFYFAGNSERICYPTPYAYADGAYVKCRWWLRSPGGYDYYAAYVGSDGSVQDMGAPSGSADVRIRPAIYLDFESEAFESEITFYANNGTDEHIKNTVTNFKSYYPECTFTNGTKTFCGWYKDAECQQPWTEIDIVSGDMKLYAGWTEFKTGDIIEFGSYPQSRVSDTELISELDSVGKKWVSYDYYTGTGEWADGNMTSSDYMQYADFSYNGTEYRAVKISKYRPYYTGYSSSADNSRQDENGYTAGTDNIYYFRYEPIKWKILDPSTGLVLSDAILDSQPYNNYILSNGTDEYNNTAFWGDSAKTYYANNYAESSIRDWLNDDFCNTAFSDDQQNIIKSTALDNSAYSTSRSAYDSVSTTDKIYLLSYSDVLNSGYGFSTSTSSSSTRTAQGTDYAKCQGLYVDSGNSFWRLRSACEFSNHSCSVNSFGTANVEFCYYHTDFTDGGVRAALKLNLKSEIFKPEITLDMVEDIPDCKYTGEEFKPAVTVTDGEKTLIENMDYTVAYSDNINAGTATVTVTGIEKYKGTAVKTFTINKRSVTLTSGSDTKTYDGKPLTNGNVAVSGDGFVGDEGATYDFTGSQTNAGVSDNTFTYTLQNGAEAGNYDIKVEFGTLTVASKAITEEMIFGVDNATYTGKPIERNIVVKDGDKTLTEITDYTVSYNNNTNAGIEATVTITGKGNYCGEVIKTFTISPAAQSAPAGITSTDETKCSASDGTISGLSTDMEIAFEREEYAPCTGETMTGLAPGTYSIRYAEKANYVASDSVQVVIKEGNCYGGTATCINKAVCDGCHNEYGELGDHEWKDSYTVDKEPTITEAGSESIHCKLCSATKDSKAILSLTDSHEEYKQASVEKLDSLNTEHDSVISKIIVRFADFVIERCGYDETKSYEENTAVIDKIVEEATDMINTRHYLIYGCPFLSFIANKLEPCFVAVRCFVNFVIVQIKNVF